MNVQSWWGINIGDETVYDDTHAPTHEGWEAVTWDVVRIDPNTGKTVKVQVVGWGESPNAARADLVRKIALISGQVTKEPEIYDITPTCDFCSIPEPDADGWCGNCGNCVEHCCDWEGCDPQ